jgi:hypothetical protein
MPSARTRRSDGLNRDRKANAIQHGFGDPGVRHLDGAIDPTRDDLRLPPQERLVDAKEFAGIRQRAGVCA